jgi:hypothetical protein
MSLPGRVRVDRVCGEHSDEHSDLQVSSFFIIPSGTPSLILINANVPASPADFPGAVKLPYSKEPTTYPSDATVNIIIAFVCAGIRALARPREKYASLPCHPYQ